MKQKLIAISLLFILTAPVATLYVYMQFEKKAIKRELKWKMITGIDQEELVLLKFTKEETQTKLRWEHSKEFEYNGQMYDIVSSEIKGDTIYYRCWWDYEETKLNKKLEKLVVNALNKDNTKRDFQRNLQTYFHTFFFEKPLTWQIAYFEKPALVFQKVKHPSFLHSILITPPTPPPKVS